MKTTTVVPFAGAAAYVLRLAAPIADSFGGTGLPAGAAARWRHGILLGTTAPPDSASGALTV